MFAKDISLDEISKVIKILKPYQSVIKKLLLLIYWFNYILKISKKCDLVYIHKTYAEISKTYENSRSKLKTWKQLGLFLITYLHWWCNIINNKKYSHEQNNIAYLLYIHNICTIFFFFFLCSKVLIAEEKLIHVETPGSYQQVALSEFCITPSEDQTFKFDVKFFFTI